MANGAGVNQGKTAFLEDFLPGNRDADLVAVNRAWSAAGNQGTISESLFGKLRSKLGLTGKKGANGLATREDARPAARGTAKSSKGSKGKGASKVAEAPPQSNGREGDTGPSKSAFVEDLLGREPQANLKAINGAWASAGHEGEISSSIFYKVKRGLGVTGTPSPVESASPDTPEPVTPEAGPAVGGGEGAPQLANGRGAPIATAPGVESPAKGDVGQVVDQVEAGIDDLMFTLKVNGGMPEVEAALRAARRLLTRNHEG